MRGTIQRIGKQGSIKQSISRMPTSYSAALSGSSKSSRAPANARPNPAINRANEQSIVSTTSKTHSQNFSSSPPPRPRSPNPAHKPNTSAAEECVYVLTFLTSPPLSDPLNSLRKQYFPAHLNRTPAHLTLFHALPHSRLDLIEDVLSRVSSRTRSFKIRTGRPFRMRKGVGISVSMGNRELKRLHEALKEEWMQCLSEQDRGGWRPHWTVMNKVNEEEKVQKAFEEVEGMRQVEGLVEGLGFWRYERGHWEWVREWRFEGA